MGRDRDRHFLTLILDRELRAGETLKAHLEYRGPISPDGLSGLYQRYYWEETTESREIVYMTQMQPVHAREVFPCLDEPDLKVSNWSSNSSFLFQDDP